MESKETIDKEEQPREEVTTMEVEEETAAPGAWEVTKGSRDKSKDDEPKELSAEQQDEKTLEALDEMTSIMEGVRLTLLCITSTILTPFNVIA